MTPAEEKNSAEFLACVVELIRAHGKYPGLSFGEVLMLAVDACRPGWEARHLMVMPHAEIAKALREYADDAPVALQTPSPRSCQNHSDCEAADAAREMLGVQIRHVPWTTE